MMIPQWLRRLTESNASIDRAEGVDGSRPTPKRRLAVGLEILEGRLVFSVIVVNGAADGTLAGLRGNGTLDLREAIELATHPNTNVDGYTNASLTSTIQFSPSLDGQTINLVGVGDSTVGPSAFGIGGNAQVTIDGQTGLTQGVTIARPLTFSTTVNGVPVSGNTPAFRFATVQPNSALTLKGMTIDGFIAKGFTGGGGDSAATGGGSAGLGGAIFNRGDLTILNSTLTNNTAQGGAGGSVVYVYHTLLNGQVERLIADDGSGGAGLAGDGNAANAYDDVGGNGGGPSGGVGGTRLYPDGRGGGFGGGGGGGSGTLLPGVHGPGGNGGFGGGGGGGADGTDFIYDVGTSGGRGGFGGGGGGGFKVGLPHGGLSGVGGAFGGNANLNLGGGGAGLGGVVFNFGGTVTVTNSTFTRNSAIGGAGGTTPASTLRATAGKANGGAIFSFNGTVTLDHDTLTANIAADGGREVFLYGDGTTAKGVINKSILGEGDTLVSDLAFDASDTGSGSILGSGNLIRKTTVFGSEINILDSMSQDPALGDLQPYGGVVETIRPLSYSPIFGVDIGASAVDLPQSVTFDPLPGRTFGDADFTIDATASSGLPVTFTATGNATVEQIDGVWTVHLTGAGDATITAVQDGTKPYAAASASQTFTIAKAASVTTTVATGTVTYNGAVQDAGTGVVTGAGGLNTGATSFTYSANADGTGVADRTNVGTYYVTAHYAGDDNHLASDGAAVAVRIVAKHITGAFTVAEKVYDGTTTATVKSRSLVGVVGTDAVSLVGGKAVFTSKYAGARTVTLFGATLSGAAARNYVLDSVATTTATITPKSLSAAATTQSTINAATKSPLSVRIVVNRSGIVDGQSVAQLFDGAYFTLAVGGRTYSVRAQAKVVGSAVEISYGMTSELKAILAANTKATNASKAPTVALNFTAKSKDGNYVLAVSAWTKLFNTSK